jgi:Tfp pilus assembly protein PilO
MLLKPLTKRERTILFVTGGLIAFYGVVNFVVEPVAARFDQVDKEIVKSTIKLEKALQLLSQKEELQGIYKALVPQEQKEGISYEEEMAAILERIGAIASNNSLRITSIKPGPLKNLDFYSYFTLDIEAEAAIDPLTHFIYDIQSSGNFLKVYFLELQPKGGGSLAAKMQIVKFSFL